MIEPNLEIFRSFIALEVIYLQAGYIVQGVPLGRTKCRLNSTSDSLTKLPKVSKIILSGNIWLSMRWHGFEIRKQKLKHTRKCKTI